MGWAWLKAPGKKAERPRTQCAHQRYLTPGLTCQLGILADLSASGARVTFDKRPGVTVGDSLALTIGTAEHSIRISARVAWIRAPRLRPGELGLRFEATSPAVASAVLQLARFGYLTPDFADPDGAVNAGRRTARAEPVRATMNFEDLYALFGVRRFAADEEIRAAYRRLVRQYHPDVNKDAGATEHFAHISKAYSVLREPQRRAKYDELLKRAEAA